MLIDEVIERLNGQVAALTGRVEGAAALSLLMREGAVPGQTPAAFVLPLGRDGGPSEIATRSQRQKVTVVVGVLIVSDHGGSATAGEEIAGIDALEAAVTKALAGWQPPSADDTFIFRRSRLAKADQGVVMLQAEFSTATILRA